MKPEPSGPSVAEIQLNKQNQLLLEQLTQRFQKYKKDVNATLINLYKDTKRLL